MGAIVARAPLRVALGGGGTDLPSYYRQHGGFVVSTAIDRYVHMLVSARLPAPLPPEAPRVGGGRSARRRSRHPILREVLTRHWDGPPVELASVADAPPGTGLGSSGAYAVCAIKALHAAAGPSRAGGPPSWPRPPARSRSTCSSGASASRTSTRPRSGACARTPSTPTTRSTSASCPCPTTWSARCARSSSSSSPDATAPPRTCSPARCPAPPPATRRCGAPSTGSTSWARQTCAALEAGDLARFGELMNDQWDAKRDRAPGTVIAEMDALRERALAAGALGAVSLGAGGGGFVLVYTPDPERTRQRARRRARAALRHRSARVRGPGHAVPGRSRRGLEWPRREAPPGTGPDARAARGRARGERRGARLPARLPLGHGDRGAAGRGGRAAVERRPAQRLVGVEPRPGRTSSAAG